MLLQDHAAGIARRPPLVLLGVLKELFQCYDDPNPRSHTLQRHPREISACGFPRVREAHGGIVAESNTFALLPMHHRPGLPELQYPQTEMELPLIPYRVS